MPLNSSGPISFGGPTVGQSINKELLRVETAEASMDSALFRNLAVVPTGQISASNFYGKVGYVSYMFEDNIWPAGFTHTSGFPEGNEVLTNGATGGYLWCRLMDNGYDYICDGNSHYVWNLQNRLTFPLGGSLGSARSLAIKGQAEYRSPMDSLSTTGYLYVADSINGGSTYALCSPTNGGTFQTSTWTTLNVPLRTGTTHIMVYQDLKPDFSTQGTVSPYAEMRFDYLVVS